MVVLLAACAEEPPPDRLDVQDCEPRSSFVIFSYVNQGGFINKQCRIEPTTDVFMPSPRVPGNQNGAELLAAEAGMKGGTKFPQIVRAADGWYTDATTLLERTDRSDGVLVYVWPVDPVAPKASCRWLMCEEPVVPPVTPVAVPWQR